MAIRMRLGSLSNPMIWPLLKKNISLLLLCSALVACASVEPAAEELEAVVDEVLAGAETEIGALVEEAPESTLLTNGAVYTVNADQPWAEAVFFRNGVIEFVGSTAEAEAYIDDGTEVIDLGGAMVMPGIIDVHAHPLEAGSEFMGTCLLDSSETNAEHYIGKLQRCAPRQKGRTDWVLGWGHSVFTLLEAERMPKLILDDAIPDQPVLIMEETSHSFWANSMALELAGITADTPNPPGGVIVKDAVTGEPTGLLFDSVGDLIIEQAWQPTDAIKRMNYSGLKWSIRYLNRHGITGVSDARTYWHRDFQDAWLQADAEGELTVRTSLGLWAYPSEDDATQLAYFKDMFRRDPHALLNIDQIKVYSDGILINSTAAMLDPYVETLGGIPSEIGLNYFTEERLTKYIAELSDVGYDFHIHAIGDRAIYESLNAIEAAQAEGARHRLTHLEVVDPADYPRFAELGVIADMQVAGDFTHPENWDENRFLIGTRANNLVPVKDLYEANATVTLSSDWDVSPLNPFIGMQNALTRAPQNLSSLDAVVEAYTINAAYAMRLEEVVGSIEVGKYADLIVLDQNIFEVDIYDISETTVDLTFLAGEVVYER